MGSGPIIGHCMTEEILNGKLPFLCSEVPEHLGECSYVTLLCFKM